MPLRTWTQTTDLTICLSFFCSLFLLELSHCFHCILKLPSSPSSSFLWYHLFSYPVSMSGFTSPLSSTHCVGLPAAGVLLAKTQEPLCPVQEPLPDLPWLPTAASHSPPTQVLLILSKHLCFAAHWGRRPSNLNSCRFSLSCWRLWFFTQYGMLGPVTLIRFWGKVLSGTFFCHCSSSCLLFTFFPSYWLSLLSLSICPRFPKHLTIF